MFLHEALYCRRTELNGYIIAALSLSDRCCSTRFSHQLVSEHLLFLRRATPDRPAAAVRLTVARRAFRPAAVNQQREKERPL